VPSLRIALVQEEILALESDHVVITEIGHGMITFVRLSDSQIYYFSREAGPENTGYVKHIFEILS